MSYQSKSTTTSVRRFHLRHIRPPCNLLVLGPPASGKTIIINSLLRNIRIRGRGIVFSSDPMNYDYLNQKYWEVYEPSDEEIDMSKCDVRVFEDDVSEECFNVFGDKRAFNIIALQSFKQLPQNINHSKLDYLIMMGGLENLRKVWFDLAGIVPKYKQFKKIYEACTENYDFLIIDFSGHSRKILDHVYWGRSDWRYGELGKRSSKEKGLQEKEIKIEDITSQISKTFEIHQASEANVISVPVPEPQPQPQPQPEPQPQPQLSITPKQEISSPHESENVEKSEKENEEDKEDDCIIL